MIYLLASVPELVNGTVLLGAVPVDMRDRTVHPLIALAGAVALIIGRRMLLGGSHLMSARPKVGSWCQ